MWWPTCNYNTCTRGRRASFLILLMMGALRPKHVEWLCRNKTCTVLHQVGVLFDLYYDARKHKSKFDWRVSCFMHIHFYQRVELYYRVCFIPCSSPTLQHVVISCLHTWCQGQGMLISTNFECTEILFSAVLAMFYICVCCVWVVSVRPPVISGDFRFRILWVLVHNSEVCGLAGVWRWSVTAVAQLLFSVQWITLTLHLHCCNVDMKLVAFAVRKVLAFAVFEERSCIELNITLMCGWPYIVIQCG